jgi:hypothetical protein
VLLRCDSVLFPSPCAPALRLPCPYRAAFIAYSFYSRCSLSPNSHIVQPRIYYCASIPILLPRFYSDTDAPLFDIRPHLYSRAFVAPSATSRESYDSKPSDCLRSHNICWVFALLSRSWMYHRGNDPQHGMEGITERQPQ